jgi:hypothetical protein
MSGWAVSLSANREAPIDHELTVANMQVVPVSLCVASPRELEPASRSSNSPVYRSATCSLHPIMIIKAWKVGFEPAHLAASSGIRHRRPSEWRPGADRW